MIRVSGQSKSRPVKAAGAEVGAQQRNEKLHAAVAKNAFSSENVQNTSASESARQSVSQSVSKSISQFVT